MYYRVKRKAKGERFYIESAIFCILGWYFMRKPMGKAVIRGHMPGTIVDYYTTKKEAEAALHIMWCDNFDYNARKNGYKGNWK